jgi:LytS/YehU family sensor histidine kinase
MTAPNDNRTLSHLGDMGTAAVALWWNFFDWIALLSWGKLAMVWLLVLIVTGPVLHFGGLGAIFLFGSIAIKVLAGGKLRAEVKATEATARADVEALERRVLEAQLAALQAQVEPHFLFNTLALIGQLIETDPPQAAKIHALLIQYLRTAIPQMREVGGGTLGRQVELANAYLTIMQARMGERLKVLIEIPPSLAQASFPPLMLQTLVENAVKHGLEPKTDGGLINIRAFLVDDTLCVEVSDNGMGFNPQSDDGLGLANLRERLKMLFNGRGRLVIEVPAQGGCRCTLRLPYQIAGGST